MNNLPGLDVFRNLTVMMLKERGESDGGDGDGVVMVIVKAMMAMVIVKAMVEMVMVMVRAMVVD